MPFQIDFGGKQPRVVGIDLGTTNSLVAYMDLTAPKIIPGEDGDRLVPSVVSFSESGEIVVGNEARRLLMTQPERTVYSVKRLMGRGVADVEQELKLFPFHIAADSESVIKLQLGDRQLTPPEISAFVLRQLKKNAESISRRAHHASRHHGPSLLQRCAAAGDQGRWTHCGVGRVASRE